MRKRAARVVRDRRGSARDRMRRLAAKSPALEDESPVEPIDEYDTDRIFVSGEP